MLAQSFRILSPVFAAIAAWGLLFAPSGSADELLPVITFDDDQVSAANVSSGGLVAVFSVRRESLEWLEKVIPLAELIEDADFNAAVETAVQGAETAKSIWAVVDIETGTLAVDAPTRAPAELAFDPASQLVDGLIPELTAPCQKLYLMVARPGVGAWSGVAGDGTVKDLDQAHNGSLRMALDQLSPIGATSAPMGTLVDGDIIVGIDPDLLEVFTYRYTS